MTPNVRRGDVWLIDWNPARGSEQAGVRPALVVQNDVGNAYSSTTIVAAISTRLKKEYPFQVGIEPGESGLPETGIVKLEQIMTVDQARLLRKVGALSPPTMTRVEGALKRSLGIP